MTPDASPQPNVLATPPTTGAVPFYLLAAATGVGAGIAAGALMTLLRFVQHVAWSYRDGGFEQAVEKASASTRIWVLLAAGIVVAVVVPLLQRLRSEQPSELEATIWFRDGRLPPLPTVFKAILSIVIVGLGASLGREAAPKQTGTLIGSLLAQGAGLAPAQRRLLAACGAGAGLAAVYNVPFGGALFALEVLLGSLSLPLVAPAFLATLSGTASFWLFFPDEPTYQVPAMSLTPSLAAFALVAAPVAGVVAALFVKLVAAVGAHRPKGWLMPPAALAVFLGLGLLAIPYPGLLGNGKDLVEAAALDRIAPSALFALAILKPLATAACLGASAPGGLFTPTLALGAMLGGALGHVWLIVWPGAPAGACALIVAAAVLAGTTKGPVSAMALMLELVRHVDGLVVPSLCAVALATAVAHGVDPRSTYTSRLRKVGGADRLGKRVSAATPVAVLTRLLVETGGPLTVVDAGGSVVGTVTSADMAAVFGRLVPLEIATAIDVVEMRAQTVKGLPSGVGSSIPRP